MCGITGFFSTKKEINTKNYYKSHLLIKHRGPDDEGFVGIKHNGKVETFRGFDTISELNKLDHVETLNSSRMILGHRRLSIIDLSEYGHQPYTSEDQNYFMVFNGEIFNYLELKKELEDVGYLFNSHSDTEVVLKAYMHWKEDCFNKFNGMWALAIYDRQKNKIIMSRDRFGIKPLYYMISKGIIYFSSEMKFIKSFIDKKLNINLKMVSDYLKKMHINHTEETFYEEIKEVLPAHYLEFQDSIIKYEKFWSFSPTIKKYSKENIDDNFKNIFETSLTLRMRSDVFVGGLLSGGLDSSTILGGLSKLNYINNNNYKAFSAVFEEEDFSEKKYIEDSSKKFSINTTYVTPNPKELLSYLDDILYYVEEPFRSLSIYSQYLLYKQIKNSSDVKVLLNGQGADELFGGYAEDYFTLLASYLSKGKLISFFKEFFLLLKNRKIKLTISFPKILNSLKNALFKNNYFNNVLFEQLRKTPMREYLKYDDRMSMKYGLEARVPFLDYNLVEFAFSIDQKYKIHNFVNKEVIRNYAKGIIPNSILNRKDKMGFVSPQESWQKQELSKDFDYVFENIRKNNLFNFNGKKIFLKYQKYKSGKFSNWTYIWRCYCLYKWGVLEKLIKDVS